MTLRLNLVHLAWDQVTGSTNYEIQLDGVKVAIAGPKARTTKITIPEGAEHKVTIKAQPSGTPQEAKFEWSSVVVAPPPPPPPTGQAAFWSASSPINTVVGSNPTVTLNYGQGIFPSVSGIGLNGGGWGCAVFHDNTGSRRTIINPAPWYLDNVPMPAQWPSYHNAMVALGDSERHHVVVDGDRVHNVYGANLAYTTAEALGEMRAKTVSSGFWNNSMGPWLGRASGFCSAAGIVLKAEVDAGLVPHALSCCWDKAHISTTAIAPATTSDGSASVAGHVPMGSRLQLRPELTDSDFLGFGISPYYLPVARALRDYGCYIGDSSSWMALYAESWNDNGQVVWPSGWYPGSANLVQHLRIIAPPTAPTYDDRTVFGQPHL